MYLLRRQITLIRPFNFIHLCNIFHVKALDFFLSFPRGPVEPDTLSLWMDLFSLDSVILIIVTCNCLPFSYSRPIFRTHFMTSAENSVSEPPNLKPFWGRIPLDPLAKFVPSALAILPPPPHPLPKNKQTNKTRYSPVITRLEPRHTAVVIFRVHSHHFNIDRIIKYSTRFTRIF